MKRISNKWFYFLCLLFLYKPGIISGIASLKILDMFFNVMRLVVMLLCVLLVFIQKGKLQINRTLVLVCLITLGEVWKIISSAINGYSYNAWGATLNTFGISLFSYLSINRNKMAFLDGGRILFGIYVIINTVTVILFPNGMYASTRYTQNFFLSYRNAWFVFYLLALYICLLNNELYPSKKNKAWLLLVIVCEYISMIREWTANGLFCITVGLVLYIIWKKQKIQIFPVKAIFLGELAISVGLILFHLQDRLLFVIVGILRRDPTLSQRVRIWNNALQAIKTSLWFGHGSLDSSTATTFLGYGVDHAHSYYLNTIFYFGLIGLMIGLFIILYAFSDSRKKSDADNIQVKIINLSILVSLLTAFQGESMMSIGYYFCLMYIVSAYTNSPKSIDLYQHA